MIGLKIAAARAALRAAGFPSVSLNTPCNKGTLASQSVAASLATPGKAPDVRVGATPLSPGADAPAGAPIGIIWSGCFGDASDVPAVVGLTFPAGAPGHPWRGADVGLFLGRQGHDHDDDDDPARDDHHVHGAPTTTEAPETTTTAKVVQTVLSQAPAAHTVLHPGATVTLTMHHCPQ